MNGRKLAWGLLLVLPVSAQVNPCVFLTTPSSISAPATETLGAVQIQGPSGCRWTSASNSPWITISFGTSGTTSGSTGYRIQANTTPSIRNGSMTIAGNTVTVTQAAANCQYTLTPSGANIGPGGGGGSFAVASGCTWTAVPNVEWIAITAGGSATGSGNVTFQVAANNAGSSRSGGIRVGDKIFNVSQGGGSCTYTFTPLSASIAAEGGSGTVNVSSNCAWQASSNADWISITGGGSSTSGAGTIGYTVKASNNTDARTGGIVVGGASFLITQAAAACNFSLNPTSATFPAAGGSGSVTISTSCGWTAVSSASWIAVTSGASGSGNGMVNYTVSSNSSSEARTGFITIGGQNVTVNQAGGACSLTLTPAEASVPEDGGSGSFRITAAAPCTWTPVAEASWVNLTWTNDNGNGVIRYSASANTTGEERVATIRIATAAFVLKQEGFSARISAARVVNAASGIGGAVAPGMMIAIYGGRLGPDALAGMQLTSDGQFVTDLLAGTQVLIDGQPAPMIYAWEPLVSAIVPFGVAGRRTVSIQVVADGRKSNLVTLPVVDAAPGIFTQDSSGTGPGAIRNADYSENSIDNPVERGSAILVYATGGGVMDPPLTDGQIAGSEPSQLTLPVTAEIGGVPAQVMYAGSAQGTVAGGLQINIVVPADVTPGPAVPVIIRIGDAVSRDGVTVAVK